MIGKRLLLTLMATGVTLVVAIFWSRPVQACGGLFCQNSPVDQNAERIIFTDNGDGTVSDNLTGLIWLKDANCFSVRTWSNALSDSNGLADGSCGLTDASNIGDWRLPNLKELMSVFDLENYDPALPTTHPFINVETGGVYWSSSTDSSWDIRAHFVYPRTGGSGARFKTDTGIVWPVRDPL